MGGKKGKVPRIAARKGVFGVKKGVDGWVKGSLYQDAVIAGKVKECVLKHATMASRQDKPVAVEPVGVFGIVAHHLIIQDVSHWCATHGESWMT